MTRHLDEELVFEVLGHFWILEPLLICDCLQHCDLVSMVSHEFFFILIQKYSGLHVELFEDHIKIQAHKDWEKHSDKFVLVVIQTLINKVLEFGKIVTVITWISPCVHVLILACLRCCLTFADHMLVILHECLQIFDCEVLHISALCQIVGTLVLTILHTNSII